MKYFRDTTDVYIEEDTVVTLGKFDGLHSGHQYLLQHLQKIKQSGQLKSVIFTFTRPPKERIEQEKQQVLSTLDEKEYIFAQRQIDYLIEYPFTEEVMYMSAEEFVDMLVKRLHVKAVIVGTDFRFGYQRKGDPELLEKLAKQYGYQVTVVEKKQYHGEDISSTMIRELVKQGKLQIANELLGYDYFFQGKIEHGNEIGRTIGIPTLNLLPAQEKIIPPFGVYASLVEVGQKWYGGITNIGIKPTVGDHNPVGVETHVFDFTQDIYGETVRIHLKEFIRPEKKFASVEEMKQQIRLDMENVSKMLQTIDKNIAK